MADDGLGRAVKPHPQGTTVAVRVVPRARRTQLAGRHGDAVKIKVAAPPVDGAANRALARFLADLVGVRPAEVEVLTGERGRDKILLVRVEPQVMRAAIADRLGAE